MSTTRSASGFGSSMGGYASTDFLWDGMRLSQETHHDRQGEEALTYLYESNSYMPLARIDQDKATANDANGRDPFGLSPCSNKSTPESFEDWVARSRGKADVYLRSAEGQEPSCVRIAKDPSTRYAKNRGYGLDLLTDETGQLPRSQARSVEQAVIDAKRGEFANIDNSIHPSRPLYNVCCSMGLKLVAG
ncbi:hypothetical protein [Burkholderia aenigmatica]|uniref:hypothetical protein n=1 Tax=Burkholderia aenigmatica TaxID=2015348 RepID=UPI00265580EB|nr:hypothetical protein [Burkholderia aenigmatica]MDN7876828.1 hypothetical protein [Burkholderia aenigmatica]